MSYNIKEIRVNSFPRLVLAWNNAVAKVIFLLIGWSTTVMPEFGERVTCDGFFGLFWFWCVCFEWRRVALRNESLIFKNKKKNQVKPVNPTFRLNFFILACPCLPEDWALVALRSVDMQTHRLMDLILSRPNRGSGQPLNSIPKPRIWNWCYSPASWPHPLQNHCFIAMLFLYSCKHTYTSPQVTRNHFSFVSLKVKDKHSR